MSLVASARLLQWERSSSEKALNILQPARSEMKEAGPLSGDYSFVESNTSSKSLPMRLLDPIHDPSWDHVVALPSDAWCVTSAAWSTLLHRSYDHQPCYLQVSLWHRLQTIQP